MFNVSRKNKPPGLYVSTGSKFNKAYHEILVLTHEDLVQNYSYTKHPIKNTIQNEK